MEKYRIKIEELSSILEKKNFSPVAARIILYLLIHPENEATFEELNNYYKVSKSAISNALKMLENSMLIESKTKEGARKRYFSPTFEKHIGIEALLEHHNSMKNLMQNILNIRESNKKIDNEMSIIVSFLEMMHDEMPKLYEKYKKKFLLNKQ